MEILTRIKIGFFEMKPYMLKAEKRSLLLIPLQEGDEQVIILSEDDILAVTLTQGRLAELEIQTRNELYSGIFAENYSLAKILNHLKKNLDIHITCEFKGGKKHA